MIDPTEYLPFWLKGTEIVKLAHACKSFWSKAYDWIELVRLQQDILSCHPKCLPLHGWGRQVERFPGEDIDLYRKRVFDALANAKDSGHVAGLNGILSRFAVDVYGIEERAEGIDPDIVTIHLTDGAITKDQDLVQKIIQKYGRTCRRYSLTVTERVPLSQPVTVLENHSTTDKVMIAETMLGHETINVGFSLQNFMIDNTQTTEVAQFLN